MEIREATAEDSDAIFDLANQLHESLNVARTEFQSVFAEILQRQDSMCLVASNRSKVVGYITASVHPVLIQGENSAYVDEIVVLPDIRGKGIGTALMSQMEHWARKHKCGLVGLASGGATLFYEQLGYQSRASYYKKYL